MAETHLRQAAHSGYAAAMLSLAGLHGHDEAALWYRAAADIGEVHTLSSPTLNDGTFALSPDHRTLATDLGDGTVLLWDLAEGVHSKDDVSRLWEDLGSLDGRTAYRATWGLVTLPRETVNWLGQQLRPAGAGDYPPIDRLIADLDSERFAIREIASHNCTSGSSRRGRRLRRRWPRPVARGPQTARSDPRRPAVRPRADRASHGPRRAGVGANWHAAGRGCASDVGGRIVAGIDHTGRPRRFLLD